MFTFNVMQYIISNCAARQENHADVDGALDHNSRKNRKNKFFFFRDCAGACGLNVALTIKDEQVKT